MGNNRKKKKAAAAAAAALHGEQPPADSGAAANGGGIPPPMPTSVEPANGGAPPAVSTAAIGDEVLPQPPSVEAVNGDESPLDSAAAANRDGVPPPPPPFSVDKTPLLPVPEANGDVIPLPVDSAAEANGDAVEQPPSAAADNGGSEPAAETGLGEDSPEERRDPSLEREGDSEKLKALNDVLVKEAVETRGQVAALAALVDERSADAGALAVLEPEVLRAALAAPLRALTEEGVALRACLADDQELLQAAEARAAREADARREAAARVGAAALEERRILELLSGKEAEAAAATKTVSGLEAVVSELAGKSTELCAENGELEKQLGEVSASVGSVLAQKAVVEGSFMDYRKSTGMYKQEMEGKLGEKSKQLVALRSSMEEMEVKFQSLEADFSSALSRNKQLDSELETSKTELAAAKTELEKLLVEIADVGEKYTTVVAEVGYLRDKIDEMMTIKEAAVSALATEKTRFEKELDGMKRKIDKIQRNKDSAMASFHQKDAEAAKLRAELNGLRDSIAEQNALCEKLRAKSSSLQDEVDTVQKALGQEKAEGDKLRSMLGEAEKQYDEKYRETGVLKAEVQNKRAQIYTLNGELKKLQLAVAEAKQRGRSGVWTWLCPTTTVIAAASFAYAARSR